MVGMEDRARKRLSRRVLLPVSLIVVGAFGLLLADALRSTGSVHRGGVPSLSGAQQAMGAARCVAADSPEAAGTPPFRASLAAARRPSGRRMARNGCPTMVRMEDRATKRRGWRVLLPVSVIVVGGSALLGYALRSPESVHRGTVSYFAPAQDATSDPAVVRARRKQRTVGWAGWGFDSGHRRHNPQAQQRPPFSQLWAAGLDSLVEFPPVVDAKGAFIETASGSVIALNPESGKRRWTRKIPPPLATSPALDKRRVYVSSLGGVVLALRRTTGKPVWRYRVGARSESSPLLVNGTIYFGAEDGTLTALNARTGRRRWRVKVGGAVKGSPAYSGGLLVVGSYDGHVYGFEARNGARRWRTGGLGTNNGFTHGSFYSTPTIAYGRVYIGSTDGRVYSLVASTGKIAWTGQTGGYVYAGPAVVHQEILIGSYDGWFYSFNARTGQRRWRFKAGARISGSATVVDDIVYFSTFGNGTFGLSVRTGRQVWRRFEGRYSPVVATRDAFYFVGYNTVRRLRPSSHARGTHLRTDGTVVSRGARARTVAR
jgi:outer membrane protein assembly factor BamB